MKRISSKFTLYTRLFFLNGILYCDFRDFKRLTRRWTAANLRPYFQIFQRDQWVRNVLNFMDIENFNYLSQSIERIVSYFYYHFFLIGTEEILCMKWEVPEVLDLDSIKKSSYRHGKVSRNCAFHLFLNITLPFLSTFYLFNLADIIFFYVQVEHPTQNQIRIYPSTVIFVIYHRTLCSL